MRKVSIYEDSDGAYIEISGTVNGNVRYEFDCFEEALEALPNLEELE